MEILTFIFSAFLLLLGYAVWDDLKVNNKVGWGKIIAGICFGILMLYFI